MSKSGAKTRKANKSAAETRKDLKNALLRLEHGRGRIVTGKKISITISSVAREADVHRSMVHREPFSDIADKIRAKQGKETRKRVDVKNEALKKANVKAKESREEIAELKEDLAKMASINATLMAKIEHDEAVRDSENVVGIMRK